MSLSDLANLATIVQGIVVIVSIGFVWYQLRENGRLTRAANTQKFIELSSPFNLQLVQDREMAKLWMQGAKEWDKMDEIDKERYLNLLVWWLLLHENIYHQWKKNLLDKETYTAWKNDLEDFISAKNLNQHWDHLKANLEASFVDHVSQLIVEQTTKSRIATEQVAKSKF
jgi:hypothetical protein